VVVVVVVVPKAEFTEQGGGGAGGLQVELATPWSWAVKYKLLEELEPVYGTLHASYSVTHIQNAKSAEEDLSSQPVKSTIHVEHVHALCEFQAYNETYKPGHSCARPPLFCTARARR